MSQIFRSGEEKVRPGVYYRYSNRGQEPAVGAIDGINAIVMKSSWGPVGVVTTHTTYKSALETYGESAGMKAIKAFFDEGANTVHIYRLEGTDGAVSSGSLGENAMTLESKCLGNFEIKVKTQLKPGDNTKMQCLILIDNIVKETYTFNAGENSAAELGELLKKSNYVVVTSPGTSPIAAAEVNLTGGKDPTVANADYAVGFYALESYFYNVIITDTEEDTVATLLSEYIAEAHNNGKFVMAVFSGKASTDFDDRKTKASSYNNPQIIFVGNGYLDENENIVEGMLMAAHTAGIVAATPSNQSITRVVIPNAADVTEKLKIIQYEEAIISGMLLLSRSSDGEIWFDSGCNTLITLNEQQDIGWKKIKRTKVRNELMDRLNRIMEKKVARVNCDSDGVADIIQSGMAVLKAMEGENKLAAGSQFYEDPEHPYKDDSGWFIIDADDLDKMEKIYLHYQFRANQYV